MNKITFTNYLEQNFIGREGPILFIDPSKYFHILGKCGQEIDRTAITHFMTAQIFNDKCTYDIHNDFGHYNLTIMPI